MSSLAEGADRLLARTALTALADSDPIDTCLLAMLPMAPEKFSSTFTSDSSRREFDDLLRLSNCVSVNPPAVSDEIAYAECAQLLVDSCDILVAVWNGRAGAGPGGTESTLAYARSVGRHIYIIDAGDSGGSSEIASSNHGTKFERRLAGVEALNRIGTGSLLQPHKVPPELCNSQAANTTDPSLQLWLRRTDIVARKAGWLSRLASDAIQWLSVAAVLLVTAQTLFFPTRHEIVWLEVFFIGVIMILSIAAFQTQWQKRWADYRYCAERLRAYQYLWNLPDDLVTAVRPVDRLFVNLPADDWVSHLLDWIWQRRLAVASESNQLDAEYFRVRWIADQISFYRRRQSRLRSLDRLGTGIGLVLFALTVVAAILHVLNQSPGLSHSIVFVAIAGPALAGGLAGVRSHRDHVRLMERYRQCADQLEIVARALERTSDRDTAARLILTANNIMLAEHSDWRLAVHTREVGPK